MEQQQQQQRQRQKKKQNQQNKNQSQNKKQQQQQQQQQQNRPKEDGGRQRSHHPNNNNYTQNNPRVSLTEAEVTELSDGHSHCLVCYGDLTFRGKLPCGHDDICGVCHLRMRYLHNDTKCPICKQSTEEVNDDDGGGSGGGGVIVDRDPQKKHADYPRWGDDIGSGYVHRKDVGMFFQEQYYETDIVPLFAYACNMCDFHVGNDQKNTKGGGSSGKNSPQRLLLDHLRAEHRLAMCYLCIDHKRDFVSQLPRFSPSQLQKHLKNGDGPESGFTGHPLCVFCKPKRFYDNYHLHQHLHKEHYKCHICEKQGRDNQWYKNYGSLQRHFDQQHFLCHNPQCLEARFVVFENELDLRAHELSVHGGTSTGSTKINLEFRTRRQGYDGSGMDDAQQSTPDESDFNYDLDGQAFVPEALSSQSGNQATTSNSQQQRTSSNDALSADNLHPLHVQRTEELRAHAAEVRRQQSIQSQAESFPTLQSSAVSTSSAPLVGWTTGAGLQRVNAQASRNRVGQVTEESFPSLAPSQSNSKANKNPLKANIGATRRQFAAIGATSNQPRNPASWNGGGGAALTSLSVPSTSSSLRMNMNPGGPVASGNRQSDLTPSNFPSLGRPSSGQASGHRNTQQMKGGGTAPSFSSMVDFPSMAPSSAARTGTSKKPAPRQQQQQGVPSLSSASEFPPPPSATHGSQSMIRQQMLGDNSREPSGYAASNVLQSNISAAAKATVDDMKASLGQKKFKELKKLTREFAEGGLSAEGYVDQSAVLFDRGYADPDFWSFVPALLESCPNEAASMHALTYMSSLKRQQFSEDRTKKVSSTAPTASSWGGSSANPSALRPPPNNATTAAAARPSTHRNAPVGRSVAATIPNTVQSNKRSAWGAGGTTSVVRTKAAPGSVSAAVASQGPQGGTATKFMAKEKKQQQQQQTSNNNGKKKKNKQNDELRALAFGR